jgi:hypothetical protein
VRYANRIDANQNDIVRALRGFGACVRIISQGDGIPDLLVGYQGRTILMEVKDGDKPPSAQKLTTAEEKFHFEWTGDTCVIVNSVEAALQVLRDL